MSIPIKIKRKEDGSIDNITFCPSITIEKQVWESTLNRSMVLEAENYKLKELLKIILSKTKICWSMVFQKDIINAELDEALLTKIEEVLK